MSIRFAIGVGCLLLSAFVSLSKAEIQKKDVTYTADGITMKGFLVWDDEVKGPRPGILVVHEWWGLNDYPRIRAQQLASLGYTALAVDMYGEGKVVEHPKDAGTFAHAVMEDGEGAVARFTAALEFLKKQPTVDPTQTAAIGYCFGGGIVLNMARAGVDLKAVASFHGSLAAFIPAKKPIKTRILVCNGADDSFVTAEQIETFRKEMDDAGADYSFLSLEGAKHGFSNPEADKVGRTFGLNVAYSQVADEKSWEALMTLLHDVFE